MLPASGGATASVGLSPFLDLDVSGVEWRIDPVTGYSMTGGKAIDTALLTQSVNPLELTSPNVFKRPDTLGDGGNQFVYDDLTPGVLSLPVNVTVRGAGDGDATWLAQGGHVNVTVSPEPPNFIPPSSWIGSGEYVQPVTEVSPLHSEEGDYIYYGLPDYVRDFGDKTVTLKVDGSNSEVAHIQTFFPTLASNHPGSLDAPNWFYYYSQIYNFGQFQNNGTSYDVNTAYIDDPSAYDPPLSPYGQTWIDNHGGTDSQKKDPANWSYEIWLGPDVVSIPFPVPVFHRNGSGQIERIGRLSIKGIHMFERVGAHEQAHVKLAENIKNFTVPYAGPFFLVNRQLIQLNWDWTDTDGDGIPDGEEIQLGLDPVQPDSTNTFGGAVKDSSGDQECLCEINALGEVLGHTSDWHFDWADLGLQFGPRPPYPGGPFGDFFPYRYDPDDGSNSSVSPPQGPQGALTDWSQLP